MRQTLYNVHIFIITYKLYSKELLKLKAKTRQSNNNKQEERVNKHKNIIKPTHSILMGFRN